ncbi:MAG: TolC family protein [Planctomycetaceae bacterium]|nr:TolC family protein [Planctomycetaceae bacterium]
MILRISSIVVCFTLGFALSELPAQDPVPRKLTIPECPEEGTENGRSTGITLEQLQQLAMQHNPTLAQARAETWKAHGQYVQEGLKPNPGIYYTSSEIGNEGSAGQHGAYFSQEFVTGGKLYLSSQIYAMRQRGASWERMAQIYRVENNVRSEYYKIIVARKLVCQALQIERIAEDILNGINERVAKGFSSNIDKYQATIELQNARMLRLNAEAEYQAAWNRMRAVIGWDGLPMQSLADVELVTPELEWEETRDRLLSMSPQIQEAQFRVSSAMAKYNRAVAEPIPNVTVQAGALYDYGTEDAIAQVQIGMPIPINNKNQGNIRTAHAEWIRACREVERLKLQLARDLAEEFKQYNASQARLKLYDSDLIPAATKTLELSEQLVKGGEFNYLQLLTAQRTFTQTNIDRIKTEGTLWQSQIAIDGLLLTDGLQAPKESVAGD